MFDMANLELLMMSCSGDDDDVNRVGRINDDLSFCTKLKGWAVFESRTRCTQLAGSVSCCSLLLTQDSFICVGCIETSSYLEGTGGAMVASAEYRLFIDLLLP